MRADLMQSCAAQASKCSAHDTDSVTVVPPDRGRHQPREEGPRPGSRDGEGEAEPQHQWFDPRVFAPDHSTVPRFSSCLGPQPSRDSRHAAYFLRAPSLICEPGT